MTPPIPEITHPTAGSLSGASLRPGCALIVLAGSTGALVGGASSCGASHLTTHFGYANVTGRTDQALAHLCTVTGMTDREAWAHVDAAQNLWIARSTRTWELDLNILTGAGITVQRPEPAVARPAAAERALRQAQAGKPAPIPAPRPPAEHPQPTPPGTPGSATVPGRRRLWERITGRK